MASHLENLAYVAEHDPAKALQEYRRRMAARPQQVVHAPVTLAKQEKQSMSVATAEDDQQAMENFEARAAKARNMNAHHSTTDSQAYGLGLFAERNSGDIPFGIEPGKDCPCEQFDPAQIAEYKRLQLSSGKRSWLLCLIDVF